MLQMYVNYKNLILSLEVVKFSFVLTFWDRCSKVLFSLVPGYFLYYQMCVNRLCLLPSVGVHLSLCKC